MLGVWGVWVRNREMKNEYHSLTGIPMLCDSSSPNKKVEVTKYKSIEIGVSIVILMQMHSSKPSFLIPEYPFETRGKLVGFAERSDFPDADVHFQRTLSYRHPIAVFCFLASFLIMSHDSLSHTSQLTQRASCIVPSLSLFRLLKRQPQSRF